MNNLSDVPAGKTLRDFQREMHKPDFDISALPEPIRKYLIKVEVAAYMLWISEQPRPVQSDEDVPFLARLWYT